MVAESMRPEILVFAPKEVRGIPGDTPYLAAHGLGRIRYQRIPRGTWVVIKIWSPHLKNHRLLFYEYRGGETGFKERMRTALPASGITEGFSNIGPYLLLGNYLLEPTGPIGATEIVDMREVRQALLPQVSSSGETLFKPLYETAEVWNRLSKTRHPTPARRCRTGRFRPPRPR